MDYEFCWWSFVQFKVEMGKYAVGGVLYNKNKQVLCGLVEYEVGISNVEPEVLATSRILQVYMHADLVQSRLVVQQCSPLIMSCIAGDVPPGWEARFAWNRSQSYRTRFSNISFAFSRKFRKEAPSLWSQLENKRPKWRRMIATMMPIISWPYV